MFLFRQESFQQVIYSQIPRPASHVGLIQSRPLYRANPSNIVPLPLRLFTTGTIPHELCKDDILGGRERTSDVFPFTQGHFLQRAALKLRLKVGIPRHRKNVELVTAREMDHIERAPVMQGVPHCIWICVKISGQFGGQWNDVLILHVCHNIDIVR